MPFSDRPCLSPWRVWLVVATVAIAGVLAPRVGLAQAGKPIYQKTPYDILYIKNGNSYPCYPIKNLGSRYKIQYRKTGNLKLQLVDPSDADVDPGEVMIPWKEVVRIQIFESIVLDEANELTKNKKFDAAFPYYAYLESVYPNTVNLKQGIENYLYQSAFELNRQQRVPEALSALEELFQRNADYNAGPRQTVSGAISGITDRMLKSYVDKDDINSARRMLTRLTKAYGTTRVTSVAKWTNELSRRAAVHRDKAVSLLRSQNNREAYLESLEMLRIWPAVSGGKAVALEAAKRYPIVRVGVADRSKDTSPRQVDSWSGRRISRLKNRLLVEYVEPGPSGGVYKSPYGKFEQNDDLTAVFFSLRRPEDKDDVVLNAFDLAGELYKRADPKSINYSESWASLLSAVAVRNPYELTIEFRRSNVLPEALLQIPLDLQGERALTTRGGYDLKKEDELESQWVLNGKYAFRGANQPAEILEKLYEHTSEAVNDLNNGKLDVIDRLYPSDAARMLVEAPLDVRVGRYAEPTIHVLIPNLDNPYLARGTFRRALAYAIPRQKILQSLLLEGAELEGAQVLDAPFSRESYAYDTTLPPMQFDASLGKLLTLLAANELQQIAEKKEEDPPGFKPLVIGHPATKIARVATSAIEAQLKSLEIQCSRKEFPPGVYRDLDGVCDLVFAEIQTPEPLIDAHRLLSSIGLAESPSPYIGMGLSRLNRAQDWKEVGIRLRDLHRTSMENMALIPLWQFPEHFAYRVGVNGISDGVLNIYQDVEQWQVEPQLLEE